MAINDYDRRFSWGFYSALLALIISVSLGKYETAAGMLALASTVLFIWTGANLAMSRSRSKWWGALGIFNLPGLFVLGFIVEQRRLEETDFDEVEQAIRSNIEFKIRIAKHIARLYSVLAGAALALLYALTNMGKTLAEVAMTVQEDLVKDGLIKEEQFGSSPFMALYYFQLILVGLFLVTVLLHLGTGIARLSNLSPEKFPFPILPTQRPFVVGTLAELVDKYRLRAIAIKYEPSNQKFKYSPRYAVAVPIAAVVFGASFLAITRFAG